MAGLSDTGPQVARLQMRQISPARRFSLMVSWSNLPPQTPFQEVKRHHPDELEARLEWTRRRYGSKIAERSQNHLRHRTGFLEAPPLKADLLTLKDTSKLE